MSTVSRLAAERNAKALHELSMQPGNDRCADCKTRNPRWASHNLGIFICVHCASVHRKIGTHVTKIKSLTLDSWSNEQVDNMRNMGNTKANALYNPDEVRHPPPTNMIDSERDSELEKFIRNKYEFKKFLNRSGTAQPRTSTTTRAPPPARAATAPFDAHPTISPPTSAPVSSSSFAQNLPSQPASANPFPQRSSTFSQPPTFAPAGQPASAPPLSGAMNDLLSLQHQAPTVNATLPLQISSSQPMSIPGQQGLSANSYMTGMNGASPNFGAGITPNFTAGASPNFAASTTPNFGVGASPNFTGAAPNSFNGAQFQNGSTANPFSQMMGQTQQPQAQQSFLSASMPGNAFQRQPSPFQQPFQQQQQQQQPFQQQQQPFQQQQQQQAFQQQQPYQTQPSPFQPASQPFAQSAPSNPFFAQQQQQQQQQYAGSPMAMSPPPMNSMSPPPMNMGMPGYGQTQPQQQAGSNPFTSWMTQPSGAQPGFAGGQPGGQWRPM
ncbi:ArfGap-domain-containing protein [Peniophora sp. CONT]|nr:ArfGap-domain-containing protein [Peniophora sp. CONT]